MKPSLIRNLLQSSVNNPKQYGLTKEQLKKSSFVFIENCDDNFNIYIELELDVVKIAKFEGRGCAISTASIDIFLNLIEGMHIDKVKYIINMYEKFLNKKCDTTGIDILDIFSIVWDHPSRIKCASLIIKGIRKVI